MITDCQQRVFKRYHSVKHFTYKMAANAGKNQLEQNYVTVSLCIRWNENSVQTGTV